MILFALAHPDIRNGCTNWATIVHAQFGRRFFATLGVHNGARSVLQEIATNCVQNGACTMVAQFVQPSCTSSFGEDFCNTGRAQWLQQLCNHCARPVLQTMSQNCVQH